MQALAAPVMERERSSAASISRSQLAQITPCWNENDELRCDEEW
jgi:hypothetical protein